MTYRTNVKEQHPLDPNDPSILPLSVKVTRADDGSIDIETAVGPQLTHAEMVLIFAHLAEQSAHGAMDSTAPADTAISPFIWLGIRRQLANIAEAMSRVIAHNEGNCDCGHHDT